MDLGNVIDILHAGARFQRGVHHRLRILAQRITLDQAVHDPERRIALAAEGREFKRLAGHGDKIPTPPFEYRIGTGHAALRQLREKDRVAAGIGIGAALPHRHIADARLIQRNVGGHGDAQRRRDLFAVEFHQPRRTEHAGHRTDGGVIKTHGLEVHDVAHAAEHFIGDHRGNDQFAAIGLADLGSGQQRGDAVAGVPGFAADVAVVEIEVTDHHAVGEHREIRTGLLPGAEYGGGLGAGDGGGLRQRNPRRLAVIAAQRAAQRVDNHAFGLVHDCRRQVFVTEVRGPGAEALCKSGHILETDWR